MPGWASVGGAIIGLAMIVAAALVYSVSPYEALFLAGLGAILLGVGGVARVSIPGAAVVGGAGFVMIMVAALAPGLV